MERSRRLRLTVLMLSIWIAVPGTQPATATRGLAEGTPPERLSSIRSSLQAPIPSIPLPPSAMIGSISVYAESAEQIEMAEWALAGFAAEGLELPALTIHLHEDRARCSSDPERLLNGYYTEIDGNGVIHSCGNGWTLLHELGHAWDRHALDDTTRARFMEHQGIESWSSDSWNQAGGEHLASIIAWAIEGTHPSRIGYYDQDHLAEAYAIATDHLRG